LGEKKEEVEWNPFWCLPMAETHHGDRNLTGKVYQRLCSLHANLGIVDWGGARATGVGGGAGLGPGLVVPCEQERERLEASMLGLLVPALGRGGAGLQRRWGRRATIPGGAGA